MRVTTVIGENEKLSKAFEEKLEEIENLRKTITNFKTNQGKLTVENKTLNEKLENNEEHMRIMSTDIEVLNEKYNERNEEVNRLRDDMERMDSYYQGEIQELLAKIQNLTAFDSVLLTSI